jgi:hypothetical protein
VRIVHFNEHLNWTGGVETYLLHLLPALESQGMTNTYVFARGDNNLLPRTVSARLDNRHWTNYLNAIRWPEIA